MLKKRGRTSRAEATVIPLVRAETALVPPASLPKVAKTLFASLADSAPHLETCDVPLLVSYITTTLLLRKTARRAAADPAVLRDYERLTKLQLALGTRLRLSPQSRAHPRSVARHMKQRPAGGYPWEVTNADGEEEA